MLRGSQLRRIALALPLLVLAGCRGGEPGCGLEEAERRLGAIAGRVAPAQAPPAAAEVPLRLYVDRSGSMTGYLDREFGEEFASANRSSLRRLLNQLSAIQGRIQVFGFGERLVPVETRSNQDVIATLVRQEFYADNDTRVEDVLDSVATDTSRGTAHLILTDGRRGDGAAAIAQYKRMGDEARRWTAAGGTRGGPAGVFVWGALKAPFRQVRNDQAGCSSSQREVFECPLYVFAFVPAAAAPQVLSALGNAVTHLYVAPALTDAAVRAATGSVRLTARQSDVHVYGGRTSGTPLRVLVHSEDPERATAAVDVRFELDESVARFSANDSLRVEAFSAALCEGDTGEPAWNRVRNPAEAWVKPGAPAFDRASGELRLPVELRARANETATAYRFDLVSTGRPAWLSEYEAPAQGNATSTFGLSYLLDHLGARPVRLAGFYAAIY